MSIEITSKQPIQKVQKPWGYELIWAKTPDYVGKVLHINRGHQLSLQYHERKEETIFVQSGSMTLVFENDRGEMMDVKLAAGEAHHIPPHRKHRMIANEDCDIFEVSTPFLEDVVRLEDGYGRAGTTQA
ncbi:MAG TPA: cupin [Bdellovibrionales bacterium]|nr:MAG: cupin [Bdellovibrionales bacterium GWB1_52_6]OFZ05064.1 MAG: cupin [Bdellovibrionales bacterium GWA1_52_35]OFZ34160.1 MAG: cupin [Bdellovibrionales bacterium GWC1_52_8]HAR44516.1 cupin [Bdellovibrionales bacterium]HCM41300.1 cupin [Bdellovibrionales bacterium]